MHVVLAASWLLVVRGHLQHQEDSGFSLLQTSALVSHRSRAALQEALVSGDSPKLVDALSPSTRLTGSGYHRGHYKGELDPRDSEKTQRLQEAAWAQAVETQAAQEFRPVLHARSSCPECDAMEQKRKRESDGRSRIAGTRGIDQHHNATNGTFVHQALPAHWTVHVDHTTNRTYYYNQETREVSFKVPEARNKSPRRISFEPGMEIVVEKSFTTAEGHEELIEGTIGTVRFVAPEGDNVLFLFGNKEIWVLGSELTHIIVHDVKNDILEVEERAAEEFEDDAADTGESVEGEGHNISNAVEGTHNRSNAVEGTHNISNAVEGTHNISNAVEVTNATDMDEAIKEFGLDPALYGYGREAN